MFLAVIVGCFLIFLLPRLYTSCVWRSCKCRARMDGKVVIVTGCTSGIGKETAIDLARRGAKIIMPCLYLEEGYKVRDELIKLTRNENMVVYKLDLSSFESVREFAREVNAMETKIDVLIHNAGMNPTRGTKRVTDEGIEMAMAVNCLGPFLLTHLLIDLLKKSAPSRIIVVVSWLYTIGSFDLDEMNVVKMIPVQNYAISKYASLILTRELARRLESTGVTANYLEPGSTDTAIWDGKIDPPISWIIKCYRLFNFKTAKEGAQTTIHVAVSDEVAGITGKFFSNCREIDIFGRKDADEKSKRLWEWSRKIVKLKHTDCII